MGQSNMEKSLLKEKKVISKIADSKAKEEVCSEIHVIPEFFLPPLQTELALMENFLMAVNQSSSRFL